MDESDKGRGAGAAAAVERWVRPEIRALSAYHVPPSGGLIKLDAMENPYVWPDAMRDAWSAALREVSLNRYPDPAPQALTEALRAYAGVPDGAGIVLGNGSDELIQMLALAVSAPGRAILAPEPSFSMYRMIALFAGLEFVGVPLRPDDFSLDTDAMLTAIEQHRPALVFIDYPNNPTGRLFDPADLRRIIEAAPGAVIIDEAYHAFAGTSVMSWLDEYPDLLVLRTLSKAGLAGLRLGLVAGSGAWTREIDKVRLPYNVNVLTQISALFALEHGDVLASQAARIREDRERLYRALCALPGLEVWPSSANFILFRVPAGRGARVFGGLRERGVLVKHLGALPTLHDCLRVTVGTPEENAAFLEALRAEL